MDRLIDEIAPSGAITLPIPIPTMDPPLMLCRGLKGTSGGVLRYLTYLRYQANASPI